MLEEIITLARERSRGFVAVLATTDSKASAEAASTIADGARRQLYRVDLATVVSKYASETEKNLDRIFADAERSGAIVLFDEADALFGSRSDVPTETIDSIRKYLLERRKSDAVLIAVRRREIITDDAAALVDYVV